MSDIIAIRIPKKLKDELQELNIDYAEEIRLQLEKIVKSKKLRKVMGDVDKFRNDLSKKMAITVSSAEIIRRDREHAH